MDSLTAELKCSTMDFNSSSAARLRFLVFAATNAIVFNGLWLEIKMLNYYTKQSQHLK